LLYGLLKLSRSGNIEINLGPLDMNKLAGDVKRSLDFKIREAGASVEISELPSCIGDETQINQVFSNLLENSLKYLDPERPGVIMISGNREGSESIYCVEDNGVGIESSERDRIFNIFYQARSSAAGEGLGLAIVSKILERHDGRIWIESEPGRGSRFYVALPGESTINGTGGKCEKSLNQQDMGEIH
jgi:signal transduction histidine kinase